METCIILCCFIFVVMQLHFVIRPLWRHKKPAVSPMETQRACFAPYGDTKSLFCLLWRHKEPVLSPMETHRACFVPYGDTKNILCPLWRHIKPALFPMETQRVFSNYWLRNGT